MAIFLPELAAHDISFPPLHRALAEPDGLLAMGGDLSVPRLVNAYRNGIFPWFSDGEPLLWWSPSTRAVFAPDRLQPGRTLKKVLRRQSFHFSVNKAFSEVVAQCAAPRAKQPGTWILPPMRQAYLQLHQSGHAHSIEVWQYDKLVGGLYGVQVGALFCGESMFNRTPNSAKLALMALQLHLQQVSPGWIDCQLPNPFLLQLGASTMARADYIKLLHQQRSLAVPANHWQPGPLNMDRFL